MNGANRHARQAFAPRCRGRCLEAEVDYTFGSDLPVVVTGREKNVDIALRRHGLATVLELHGRWTVSAAEMELLEFRSTIERLIAEGRTHISISIADLQGLDARGLGELVVTQQKLRAAGGTLSLVRPSTLVRKMLAVTRLDTVFFVADQEAPVRASHTIAPTP